MNFNKILYGGGYKLIPNSYVKRAVILRRVEVLLLFPFKFIVLYLVSLNILLLNGIIYLFTKDSLDIYPEAKKLVAFKTVKEFFEYFYNKTSFTIKCKNCGKKRDFTWDDEDTFSGDREKLMIEWCYDCKNKQKNQKQ